MVWLWCALCHASCHDGSAGCVGGPSPGWQRSGGCGFPVTHWNLHSDGCSPRKHHPTNQAGVWYSKSFFHPAYKGESLYLSVLIHLFEIL